MKICIDPGHGMSNNKKGSFDPGCTLTVDGEMLRESDIVLRYALELRQVLQDTGFEVFMTRSTHIEDTPLLTRAKRAEEEGCEVFLSIHVNAFEQPTANGTEVLIGKESSRMFANALLREITTVTGLRSRHVILSENLAVLKFKGTAALLELGFIGNKLDRTMMLNPEAQSRVVQAIYRVLHLHRREPIAALKVIKPRPTTRGSVKPVTDDDITAKSFRQALNIKAKRNTSS